MITIIGIGLALVAFVAGLLFAGLTGALGNEFHATAPHLARWLIKRCAAWHPESRRQDFEDELFDLVDSYAEDDRKLRALLIGLTEVRRSAWSLGVPSWLHNSEQSDRLAVRLLYGMAFGPVLGVFLAMFVEGGLGPFLAHGLGLFLGVLLGLSFGMSLGLDDRQNVLLDAYLDPELDDELDDDLLLTQMIAGLVLGLVEGLVLGLVAGLAIFLLVTSVWYAPPLGRRLMCEIRRRIPQP